MFITAKTVLASYGKLNRVIGEMNDLIEEAAVRSFYDLTPCAVQAERICGMIERRNLLIDLKDKARKALRKLSADDISILAKKFGRNKEEMYLSKRAYFRRVNVALARFEKSLKSQGIDEETFKKDYAGRIAFLAAKRHAVLSEEAVIASRIKKMKPACISGVFREADGKVFKK